jgi:LysM repeat protein
LANKKNEATPTQQTADKKQLAENISSNAPTGTTNEVTYTVKQGDYFYKIAREHNMSVADLLQLNGLSKNAVISIGQVLKLK